jgi:hypothetical protein
VQHNDANVGNGTLAIPEAIEDLAGRR